MHPQFSRRLLAQLGILAAIMAVMLGAGALYGNYRAAQREPHVESFDVERGDFVAETVNIRRMEVWYVPTDAAGQSSWKLLGNMKRSSHWFSEAQWTLPVPDQPVAAMQIMVRAYDEKAVEADRVSLPWIGERALRKELWGTEM